MESLAGQEGVNLSFDIQASMHDRFDPAATLAPSEEGSLPKRVLYATSSGFGGTGLDSTSFEGAKAAFGQGCLAEVVCFGHQQN